MAVPQTLKSLLRPLVHRAMHRAEASYVAGETLEQALSSCEHLCGRGYAFTLGYWSSEGESPAAIADANLSALQAMRGMDGDKYLSIKAPLMDFDRGLYAAILSKAREAGIPIHFDAQDHAGAGRILELITEHTAPPYDDIGFTLPGRWKRSLEDVDLATELGLTPRVVKGQWWPDPDDPERDPRAGFLAVVERLAGRVERVRIASHDPALVEDCIAVLQRKGTACDLELLYGLPFRAVLDVAWKCRVPVRIYVPFGTACLPYSVDRFRENPRLLWWLCKDVLSGPRRKRFPRCFPRVRFWQSSICSSPGRRGVS